MSDITYSSITTLPVNEDGRPDSAWEEDREPTSTLALFEGDDGGLDVAQRRTLVALLKKRFISARTDAAEWRTLMENPRLIRSRLHDLFMDLHLDVDREVAYKRQVAPEGGGRFPTLLHDIAWSREETILLVYLRDRVRGEQAAGNARVFVDRDEMLDFVAGHRPDSATDHAGDAKRTAKAIETIFRAGLLLGASTADRFEVSNAIEVLLPMERLRELLAWLRQQNEGADESDPTPSGQLVAQTPEGPSESTPQHESEK